MKDIKMDYDTFIKDADYIKTKMKSITDDALKDSIVPVNPLSEDYKPTQPKATDDPKSTNSTNSVDKKVDDSTKDASKSKDQSDSKIDSPRKDTRRSKDKKDVKTDALKKDDTSIKAKDSVDITIKDPSKDGDQTKDSIDSKIDDSLKDATKSDSSKTIDSSVAKIDASLQVDTNKTDSIDTTIAIKDDAVPKIRVIIDFDSLGNHTISKKVSPTFDYKKDKIPDNVIFEVFRNKTDGEIDLIEWTTEDMMLTFSELLYYWKSQDFWY